MSDIPQTDRTSSGTLYACKLAPPTWCEPARDDVEKAQARFLGNWVPGSWSTAQRILASYDAWRLDGPAIPRNVMSWALYRLGEEGRLCAAVPAEGEKLPEEGPNPRKIEIDTAGLPGVGPLKRFPLEQTVIWVPEPNTSATQVHEARPEASTAASSNKELQFIPGGFLYRGHVQRLSGKPLAVLRALYDSRWKRQTLDDLRRTVWCDSAPEEETIRSTVSSARKALKAAFVAVGIEGPKNPIPTADRGNGTTAWRLVLP
jgi:hypothetical protein